MIRKLVCAVVFCLFVATGLSKADNPPWGTEAEIFWVNAVEAKDDGWHIVVVVKHRAAAFPSPTNYYISIEDDVGQPLEIVTGTPNGSGTYTGTGWEYTTLTLHAPQTFDVVGQLRITALLFYNNIFNTENPNCLWLDAGSVWVYTPE